MSRDQATERSRLLDTIKADLTVERPIYRFSSYSPYAGYVNHKFADRQLIEGEISPEELRYNFNKLVAAGYLFVALDSVPSMDRKLTSSINEVLSQIDKHGTDLESLPCHDFNPWNLQVPFPLHSESSSTPSMHIGASKHTEKSEDAGFKSSSTPSMHDIAAPKHTENNEDAGFKLFYTPSMHDIAAPKHTENNEDAASTAKMDLLSDILSSIKMEVATLSSKLDSVEKRVCNLEAAAYTPPPSPETTLKENLESLESQKPLERPTPHEALPTMVNVPVARESGTVGKGCSVEAPCDLLRHLTPIKDSIENLTKHVLGIEKTIAIPVVAPNIFSRQSQSQDTILKRDSGKESEFTLAPNERSSNFARDPLTTPRPSDRHPTHKNAPVAFSPNNTRNVIGQTSAPPRPVFGVPTTPYSPWNRDRSSYAKTNPLFSQNTSLPMGKSPFSELPRNDIFGGQPDHLFSKLPESTLPNKGYSTISELPRKNLFGGQSEDNSPSTRRVWETRSAFPPQENEDLSSSEAFWRLYSSIRPTPNDRLERKDSFKKPSD